MQTPTRVFWLRRLSSRIIESFRSKDLVETKYIATKEPPKRRGKFARIRYENISKSEGRREEKAKIKVA